MTTGLIIALAIIVVVALSTSTHDLSQRQEVIIVRPHAHSSGCGPIAMFLLGILVAVLMLGLLQT